MRKHLLLVSVVMYGALSLGAAGSSKGGAGGASTSAGGASGAQAQGSGSSSNAPFESVMLAYGALDQTMQALSRRACLEVQPERPLKPTVVVITQASLTSLEAYDSFDKTALYFKLQFAKIAGAPPPIETAGAGPSDDFADTTAAVSAALAAGNTESASTITIQDISAAIKVASYLADNQLCKTRQVEVFYPDMYGEDKTSLKKEFQELVDAHDSALAQITKTVGTTDLTKSLTATTFNNLDASYNQFLQSWFATNGSTGQSGLASVLQGYGLHKLLNDPNRKIYEVLVNVAAAGGTQQDRKNLLTALITGDWIRYSGGIVLNTMIIQRTGEGGTTKILFADVMRYRTPLKQIKAPVNRDSTNGGDNFADPCASPNASDQVKASCALERTAAK